MCRGSYWKEFELSFALNFMIMFVKIVYVFAHTLIMWLHKSQILCSRNIREIFIAVHCLYLPGLPMIQVDCVNSLSANNDSCLNCDCGN